MDSGSERGSFLPPWLDDEPMAPPEAHATLMRILGAIEEYVYTGEFLPDDSYRVVFAGPCRERFLGMSAEAARSAVWANYVHPRDMDAFNTALTESEIALLLDGAVDFAEAGIAAIGAR